MRLFLYNFFSLFYLYFILILSINSVHVISNFSKSVFFTAQCFPNERSNMSLGIILIPYIDVTVKFDQSDQRWRHDSIAGMQLILHKWDSANLDQLAQFSYGGSTCNSHIMIQELLRRVRTLFERLPPAQYTVYRYLYTLRKIHV